MHTFVQNESGIIYTQVTKLEGRLNKKYSSKSLDKNYMKGSYAQFTASYRKRRNFCWGLIFVGKHPHEN